MHTEFESYVKDWSVSNLSEFAELLAKECESDFVFRGHSDADWELSTSLERFLLEAETRGKCNSVRGAFEEHIRNKYSDAERVLLSEFRLGAHHYLEGSIANDQYFEWLAMMQHHGTPTRLLDWTESPYVAMYFAFEPVPDKPRCVWALHAGLLNMGLETHLEALGRNHPLSTLASSGGDRGKRMEVVNTLLRERPADGVSGVVALRPSRMNRRMIAQRGVFLMPLTLEKSFEHNLLAALKGWTRDPYTVAYKISLGGCRREKMLEQLAMMNISRATLYPGLDGFAYSVKQEYEFRGLKEREFF